MSQVTEAFAKIYKNEPTSDEARECIVGYNDKNDPIVLKIAQAGNPLHEKTQRKYSRALEKTRGRKKKQNAIYAQILAESILMGWSGILDAKGKPVPDTLENRAEALESNQELMNEVLDIAMDKTQFVQTVDDETPEEKTEGNS